MDERFEWVTVDGLNANMIYLADAKSGSRFPCIARWEFTDQGLLGEAHAGKSIQQRTVISVDGPDSHTFDIYFTPPDEEERLVDRKVFTGVLE
jgi:hypothetical protein